MPEANVLRVLRFLPREPAAEARALARQVRFGLRRSEPSARLDRLTSHMTSFPSAVRYAIRQFRLSPVFTAAAVLTLALGIGGTTAIFTLIHAIMLRSLPVSDPARLYRIGDGDDCCVEGGPQDRWGLFSFPLYERLKAEAPEFEEVTAFQAGGARAERAARGC